MFQPLIFGGGCKFQHTSWLGGICFFFDVFWLHLSLAGRSPIVARKTHVPTVNFHAVAIFVQTPKMVSLHHAAWDRRSWGCKTYSRFHEMITYPRTTNQPTQTHAPCFEASTYIIFCNKIQAQHPSNHYWKIHASPNCVIHRWISTGFRPAGLRIKRIETNVNFARYTWISGYLDG